MKALISILLMAALVISLIGSTVPAQAADNDNIEQFVRRMYTHVLNRDVALDYSGLRFWTSRLRDGTETGASVAHGFFFSNEFVRANHPNDVFLNRLYRALLGREADERGFAYWTNHMNNGMSREGVVAGFINSREFGNLARQFGIELGTPPPAPAPTPVQPTPTGDVNPLTGLPSQRDISRNRPIAVMISNDPLGMPTNAINGISRADIVYEVPVEGGFTRLIGLFQDVSNVGLIGSIRSTRHYTANIAQSHDAILMHVGGSPMGLQEIQSRGLTSLNEHHSARLPGVFQRNMNRIPGHTVLDYHSVVTSGAGISGWLPRSGHRLTHGGSFQHGLTFTSNPIPSGGSTANVVDVRFSSVKYSRFTFNAGQNLYRMSQFSNRFPNGTFTDANDGAPVTFTNLIILRTDVAALDERSLPAHQRDPSRRDVRTRGSGTGYFASGGRFVRINWSRANSSAPFVFTLQNGTRINLGQGRTYIAMIPSAQSVAFR